MSKQKENNIIKVLIKSNIFRSSTFDNIKAKFKIKHPPLGEVIPYENGKGMTSRQLENKLGNTLTVRSSKDGNYLTIDGSYVKWLTGQNIVGTTNLISLCLLTFERACSRVGVSPTKEEIDAIKDGDFELLRLDYAVHCDAGSEENAIFLQRQIKRHWAFSRPNYSQYQDVETLYVGQSSRRRTFKSYMKGRDVEDKGGLDGVAFGVFLEKVSKRLVRLESTWRSKYLAETNSSAVPHIKLRSPLAWKGNLARRLMKKRIRALLGGVTGINSPTARRHPVKLSNLDRMAIAAHSAGISLEAFSKDKRAFRRLREKIKNAAGIDIALPLDQHQVGLDFANARLLLDDRIKYRSSHKLFLHMVAHLDSYDPDETSAVDNLVG